MESRNKAENALQEFFNDIKLTPECTVRCNCKGHFGLRMQSYSMLIGHMNSPLSEFREESHSVLAEKLTAVLSNLL